MRSPAPLRGSPFQRTHHWDSPHFIYIQHRFPSEHESTRALHTHTGRACSPDGEIGAGAEEEAFPKLPTTNKPVLKFRKAPDCQTLAGNIHIKHCLSIAMSGSEGLGLNVHIMFCKHLVSTYCSRIYATKDIASLLGAAGGLPS